MDIVLKNINKSFGKVQANQNINLSIPAGSIQGLLGENGAGKSTLMKILSGFIQPDSGEIILDGKCVKIQNPADSMHYGIGMLHQDPLDFPPMQVLENFVIGQPGSILLSNKKVEQEFDQLQQQFGFTLKPHSYVDTLTVGERQQLEILRLLHLGAQVLILDEPTTGISSQQKQLLFSTLRLLAQQDKTIILVSHKLEDVENLCSQIAVLRKGELVGEINPPYFTENLVRMMFGKSLIEWQGVDCAGDTPVMKLEKMEISDPRLTIGPVDLELCKGEVIGLAGMEGSGQDIFLRACAGLIRPTSGKIIINNRNMIGEQYHVFMKEGIKFLPASRLEEGLVQGLTVGDHFVLTDKRQGFFIDRKIADEFAKEGIKNYEIKGSTQSLVESLSGGNQQRLMLALLQTPLWILFLEHPTRGLDIESSMDVWLKLKDRCKGGTAILFFSPDLEEILQYSDRILVFYNGQVSVPLKKGDFTLDQLGQLIGGKGWQEIHQLQARE